MDTLEQIKKVIKKTPMFSHSSLRLMEITNDPDHALEDIVKIINADSILTAKVIKVVNSAAFGLNSEITSIERAVALLGDKAIVGLSIGHSQSDLYSKDLEGYGAGSYELWEHSLRTAIASREIAKRSINNVSPATAYTAGILHDVGKAIMTTFLQGKIETLLEKTDNSDSHSFLRAERDEIGVDHCQAGLELAKHWNFPEVFKTGCAFHHFPAEAPDEQKDLAYVIHLGDIIAMMGGSGTGADSMMYKIDEKYKNHIELDADSINQIMMDVIVEFEKTKGMIFE